MVVEALGGKSGKFVKQQRDASTKQDLARLRTALPVF